MFSLVLRSLYSLVFKLLFPFSNMFLSPLFYVPLFSEYGKNMVITVEKHYFPDPGRQQTTVNRSLTNGKSQVWCAAVKGEWSAQNICERTGLVTATEWCLSKLPQPTYHSHYPMLCFIVEVCSSCPVGNAWPERAAGALEWQKGRLSSRLQNHLLNPFLRITIAQSGSQKGALLADTSCRRLAKGERSQKV